MSRQHPKVLMFHKYNEYKVTVAMALDVCNERKKSEKCTLTLSKPLDREIYLRCLNRIYNVF